MVLKSFLMGLSWFSGASRNPEVSKGDISDLKGS